MFLRTCRARRQLTRLEPLAIVKSVDLGSSNRAAEMPMGYPQSPYLDPPAIYPTSTHSRFVAVGLGYVCCSLAFIVFAITYSVEFGTKSLEYELLNSAVGFTAMVLIVVGVFLLIACLFHLASRSLQPFSGETSPSGDLWDEQLDG
jgi:hypothetical protein